VYASAAHACLGEWESAKALLDDVDADNPQFSGDVGTATAEELCARSAVLRWVTALVRDWEADQSFAPEFVAASANQPCAAPPSTSQSSSTSTSTSTSTSASTTSTSSPSTTTSTTTTR